MRHNNGFSIVELLVVIAIISVLAAILLPTVEASIRETRYLSCMNQQRQLYLCYSFYAGDYRDHIPAPLDSYCFAPARNYRATNLGVLYSNRYAAAPALAYCPDHSHTASLMAAGAVQLQELYAYGVTSVWGNAVTTYIPNVPWGANTVPFNATAWNWKTPNWYTSIAATMAGNQPGGRILNESSTKLYRLNSPLCLLICGTPTVYNGTEAWQPHAGTGLNMLWGDGVSSRFVSFPGGPLMTVFSGNWVPYFFWQHVTKKYPGYREPTWLSDL